VPSLTGAVAAPQPETVVRLWTSQWFIEHPALL
jgi:hypothetical protein